MEKRSLFLGMPLRGATGVGLLFGLPLLSADLVRPPALWQWLWYSEVGLLLLGALVLLLLRAYPNRRAHRVYTSPEDNLPSVPMAAQTLPMGSQNDGPTASLGPNQPGQLIAWLSVKASRNAAADELVRQGEAALPPLKQALAQETDERRLQRLALVCARIGTPAARQLLVAAAQAANLPGRAAALRALGRFATEPAEAPLFHRLLAEELQLAQHLLHGMVPANAALRAALRYELRQGQQRLFGLLLQLYERPAVLEAQQAAAHPAGSRQAAALERLAQLLPRPLYRGLEALLDGGPLSEQIQAIDDLLGSTLSPEPLPTTIVRRGRAAFSAWTIGVALQQWHPQPATVAYLYPHLQTANLLIQESANEVLRLLPVRRPAAYDHFLTLYSSLIPLLMTTPVSTSCVSAQERVQMLKGTALFAETPENVLGTIIPIMKEIAFEPEQEIFVKGTLGTSLFIVCEGEVNIFDGAQQLATFRKGDFFGELALLDAEPRSATAVARGRVVTFRLDQEDFYDVMEERNEVLRGILRVLCQRLRRQNEAAQVPQQVAH